MTTPRDPEALLHDLEVHQAELEAQNVELAAMNEQLRTANIEVTAARDRFRALHDLAPVALVSLDEAGVIRDLNRAGEALLGTDRESAIERRLDAFLGESHRLAFQHHLREMFARGTLRGGSAELAVGGRAPVVLAIDGVVYAHGSEAPAILALRDVTTERTSEAARAKLAERSQEAQRLESLGALAGGIAHRFNNLLTVIIQGIDFVHEAVRENPDVGDAIRDVTAAAHTGAALSRQMLAYSGHGSQPAASLGLEDLVREVEPMLRASVGTVNLVIDAPDAPVIVGDERQLGQLVLELVTNALEALRGGMGTITVRAYGVELTGDQIAAGRFVGDAVPGSYGVIEVHDDGVGMTDATRGRVFDPYFSTKAVGRGLGLSAARGIIRGHHGAIAVESQPGLGTTFRVYLPAETVENPSVPREPVRPPRIETAGTVLLVDDEVLVQKMIARMIKTLELSIMVAGSGPEGIDLARQHHFDLVLMDLTMPGMGGVAAAKAIRQLQPDVPIVLITGYGEIPAESGSVFTEVLAKPFDLAAIRALVRRIVPRPA